MLLSRLRRWVNALQTDTVPVPHDRPGPVIDSGTLTLTAACHGHERLRFDYRDHSGSASLRIVEPHRLINWDRRWPARDTELQDWRTFRGDRIDPRTRAVGTVEAVDEYAAFSTPAPTPSIRWPSTWGRSALTSQSASHPNSWCTSASFLIATTAPPTDEQRSPGAVGTLRPRHTDRRPTWRTPLSRSATAEAPVPMVSWEE